MESGKCSDLLGHDRGLTPADRLMWLEAILVNDAEVMLRLVDHVLRRMTLESEQYLEKLARNTGMNRKMQQVTTRHNHSR